MFVFSQDQLDAIEAASLNQDAEKPFADAYDLIYTYIKDTDVYGNSAPGNTIAWFSAARLTNRGEGPASDLIRTYTSSQVEIRTGQALSPALLDEASDAIASTVVADILATGALPSLEQIGEHDATKALEALAAFSDDPAIWSGNFLMVPLGVRSFFSQNILEDPTDSYDLMALIKSAAAAGIEISPDGFGELGEQFFEQGIWDAAEGAATSALAYAEGQAVYFQKYNRPIEVSDLSLSVLSGGSTIKMDQKNSNGAFTTSDDDSHIIAADGQDTIYVSDYVVRQHLIDGGDGIDVVKYEGLSKAVVWEWTSFVPGAGSQEKVFKLLGSEIDYALNAYDDLYDVEQVEMTVADDRAIIRGDIDGLIQKASVIDAGGHDGARPADGDILDFSHYEFETSANSGIEIGKDEFEFYTLGTSDGTVTTFKDFEHVIGTNRNDVMIVADDTRTIEGGAGDDEFQFNTGEGVVFSGDLSNRYRIIDGGEGIDIAKTNESAILNIEQGRAFFGQGGGVSNYDYVALIDVEVLELNDPAANTTFVSNGNGTYTSFGNPDFGNHSLTNVVMNGSSDLLIIEYSDKDYIWNDDIWNQDSTLHEPDLNGDTWMHDGILYSGVEMVWIMLSLDTSLEA
ncbi:hypothetical protein [Roseobacter sp. HKCCA0434]|uniref:hypothetical protein n=1 Tax=Roseobacter sp. HKCCA0434 TaxID=3079297 RepID=UPI002905C5EA|nr:hypothetical protein [Roseobacter sp. HKCCA0434]